MKTTTSINKFNNRAPLGWFFLIPFALGHFALSPLARADCQEGCDTVNANTFLGDVVFMEHSCVSYIAVDSNAPWNIPFVSLIPAQVSRSLGITNVCCKTAS